MKPIALSIQQLSVRRKSQGSIFELNIPSFEIHRGDVVVVQGQSGCGKSTFLDVLAMTLKPERAQRFMLFPREQPAQSIIAAWQNRNLDYLGTMRSRHMGYILQTGGLLRFLTVKENILLPSRLCQVFDRDRFDSVVSKLEIQDRLNHYPDKLSVGQRQRVAIARAVLHKPDILLADEPTASVDPITAESVFDLLLDLVREEGIAAVIASHDWHRIQSLGLETVNHELKKDQQITYAYFWK